ncbi:MAG: 30S ribosomal protein S3Ae [Candidatus Micrarchaeota archaeon]|nr:MAG: 30S ribosomal protein S3Ae [Candidatus Micrarchaeota archaeon]
MAEQKRPQSKLKDKVWLKVVAPKLFDNKVIAEIPANEPEKAINRTLYYSINNLTGNPEHYFKFIKLRIRKIEGDKAYTDVEAIEEPLPYLQSLIRKGRSLIEDVFDVETKDNRKVRVKTFLVSDNRLPEPKKKDIRKIVRDMTVNRFSKMNTDEIITDVVEGKYQSEIKNITKNIAVLVYQELRKLEIR